MGKEYAALKSGLASSPFLEARVNRKRGGSEGALRPFDGELTRDTNGDGHTSRTTQIMAIRMMTPNQATPMNRTSFGRFFCRLYLNGSGFGHTSGCSRLRPDPRLFVLHAAGGDERQSHSGDYNERLHDLPRWENLSGHFLTLSESGALSLRSDPSRRGQRRSTTKTMPQMLPQKRNHHDRRNHCSSSTAADPAIQRGFEAKKGPCKSPHGLRQHRASPRGAHHRERP